MGTVFFVFACFGLPGGFYDAIPVLRQGGERVSGLRRQSQSEWARSSGLAARGSLVVGVVIVVIVVIVGVVFVVVVVWE